MKNFRWTLDSIIGIAVFGAALCLTAGCDDSEKDQESFQDGTLTVRLDLSNLPDTSAPYSILLFQRSVTVPAQLVARSQPVEASGGTFISGTQLENGAAEVVLESVDDDWQVTGEPVVLGGGTFDLYIPVDADGDGNTFVREGSVIAGTGLRIVVTRSSFEGDQLVELSYDHQELLSAVTPEITVAQGLESDTTTIYCSVLMTAAAFAAIDDPAVLALYSGLSGDAVDGALTFSDSDTGLVLPGLASASCFKDTNGDGIVSAGDLTATITGRDLNESAVFIFDSGSFQSVE